MLDVLDTAILELDEHDHIEQMNNAAELCLGTGKDRARGVSHTSLKAVTKLEISSSRP